MSTAVGPPGDTGAARIAELARGRGVTSRPDLVDLSGFTRKVVTQRVAQLVERDLLVEDGLAESRGGRAARALRFNTAAGVVAVVEIGSSALSVGLTDLAGSLLTHRRMPIDLSDGPLVALDRASVMVSDLLQTEAPGGSAGLWAVGVGIVGPVDSRHGRTSAIPLIPGWTAVDVRGVLTARFDVPIWVDNEVNAMALGEIAKGVAANDTDVVFVNLDTGIGAGVVVDGRLCRGSAGGAGELAHVRVVDDDAQPCFCGGVGCLATVAGARRLAGADDDTVARAAERIGRALAHMVAITNPAHIVVGGRLATRDVLVETVEETMRQFALPAATRDLRFSRTALPDIGGLSGAGSLALENLFSTPVLSQWVAHGSPRGLSAPIHRQPLV